MKSPDIGHEVQREGFILRQFQQIAKKDLGEIDKHILALDHQAQRLLSMGEALSMDDLEDLRFAHQEAQPYSGAYMKLFDSMNPEMQRKWANVLKFMSHDMAHITEQELRVHARNIKIWTEPEEKDASDNYLEWLETPFQGEWLEFYRKALMELPKLQQQLKFPNEFLIALCEIELGKVPTGTREVDLNEMLYTIMRSQQFRFMCDDYVVTTPKNRNQSRNELVIDGNGIALRTVPGMLWSVFYNLIKNACKELSSEKEYKYDQKEETLPNLPIYRRSKGLPPLDKKCVHVRAEKLDQEGVILIHIADSGDGLSVDEIMKSIRGLIKEDLLQESGLNRSAERILSKWDANPFAVRRFKLGQVYDLAGVARASGFSTRERLGGLSSGMGLWGINFLMKNMGGRILYSNSLDGGAMFTIVIPEDYFDSKNADIRRGMRKTVTQVRNGIEKGIIPISYPRVA